MQVFVDNFVHGDLHPGNILVQSDQGVSVQDKATLTDLWDTVVVSMRRSSPPLQLVLLDAGIVTQLSEGDLRNLRAVFTAVVLQQVLSLVQEMMGCMMKCNGVFLFVIFSSVLGGACSRADSEPC